MRVVTAGGTLLSTPLLDISDHVYAIGDRGLLGHRGRLDFASNHYLYLLYVYEPTPADRDGPADLAADPGHRERRQHRLGETVLARERQRPSVPVAVQHARLHPGRQRLALDRHRPLGARRHALVRDRATARTGRASTRGRSARYDEQSFNGKIIHVDRNGNGLPGHPFCPADTDLTHVCTKVYAKGLRNPFRFTLRAGGRPGDRGRRLGAPTRRSTSAAPGRNYGWPCYEGTGPDLRLQGPEPAARRTTRRGHRPSESRSPSTRTSTRSLEPQTRRSSPDPSIRAGAYPADFDGYIFFGDYVRRLPQHREPRRARALTGASPSRPTGTATSTSSWAPATTLYYVDWGDGCTGTGSLVRIVYTPGNRTPCARGRQDVADLGTVAAPTSTSPARARATRRRRAHVRLGLRGRHRAQHAGRSDPRLHPRRTTRRVLTGRTARGGGHGAGPDLRRQHAARRRRSTRPPTGSSSSSARTSRSGALPPTTRTAPRRRGPELAHRAGAQHPHPRRRGPDRNQPTFTRRSDHDADAHYRITLTPRTRATSRRRRRSTSIPSPSPYADQLPGRALR